MLQYNVILQTPLKQQQKYKVKDKAQNKNRQLEHHFFYFGYILEFSKS